MKEKGTDYERTHLQRTHHLRRHHCPHRLPAAGPDQSAAERLRQARAAHREPDRGAAGHRRHHHRCRAGELVEQQQLHRRRHSGRRRIRPPEAERRVNRHPNGVKVILFKSEVLLF